MKDSRELKRNNEIDILLQKELKTQRIISFFLWGGILFNLALAIVNVIITLNSSC